MRRAADNVRRSQVKAYVIHALPAAFRAFGGAAMPGVQCSAAVLALACGRATGSLLYKPFCSEKVSHGWCIHRECDSLDYWTKNVPETFSGQGGGGKAEVRELSEARVTVNRPS